MPSNLTIRPLGQLVAALSRYGQQLYQPPNDTIRGIELSTWYSPLQPVKPIAPEGTEPRGFQYWAGQNLLWTPRADAEYSAARLKQLASYPLARIAIENVKDALCKANWEIQPRPKPGEPRKAAVKRGFDDQNLLKLSRFFEAPDREHSWPEWLRPLLEDMLVIDAWTILIRKTFKGEIVELPTLRGESIVRYIDDNGFTPMPPDPAYAQNWWGIPLVNLTTDQCIYKPRNIVPRNTIASQLYGMSPTEQLAPEIEIGMKRLEFTLAYYTEGSIPGVVQVVPRGISPDKITEAMQWMNSELAGNLSARRQWRMVQGFQEPGKTDQIIFAKEPLLTDAFDDKHIRNIFFGYGVSPQRILKAMNRASAEASQEASEIEGLLPYFASLKSLIDHVIQRKFNYPDYEMVFDPFTEPDPEKEANRLKMLVSTALMTLNEGRAKLGEDARTEPEADQLGVITGSGFIPLGSQGAGLQPGEAPPNVPNAKPDGAGKKPGEEAADEDGEPEPARGKQPAGPRKPASGNKSDGHGLALEASASPAPRDIGFVSSAVIAPPVAPVELEKYSEDHLQAERPVEKKQKTIPRDRPAIRPGRLASASILGKLRLERVLQKRFKTMRRKTVKLTAAALKLPHEHLEKYSEDQVRDERGRWTDGGGSFESRDPGSKIEAEIDKNHKVDARFAPMVQEMRDRQVEAVLAYLHGAEPLAEHDDGKYRVVIMNDAERSELTFKEGDPHPVPSGKWMDFHDDDIAQQGYNAKEYRALPEAKRAEIDAKVQVERYVAAQYEDNREAFYHPKEHEAKWWAGKAAQDFVKVSFGYLVKASADKTARQILDALATEWEYVAREAEGPLVDAALAGASIGGLQLDISSVGMLDSINTVARGWAVDRAAELVGMQRTEEGRLIPNPDARWAITDTTRDELRDVITGLFDTEGELSLRDVETAIEDAGIFSDTRATMIARTEISRAQTEGNREAWRQSGLVEKVDVILSAMHDLEDECDEAAAGSPYDLDDAPEIPLHPNCECALVLAEIGEQTEEE